jgi:hypothetical protein
VKKLIVAFIIPLLLFFSVSHTWAEDEVPTSYPPLPEALAGCSIWNDVIAKYQA